MQVAPILDHDLPRPGQAVALANLRVTRHAALQRLGDRLPIAAGGVRRRQGLPDANSLIDDRQFKPLALRINAGEKDARGGGRGVEFDIVGDFVRRPLDGRDDGARLDRVAQHEVAKAVDRLVHLGPIGDGCEGHDVRPGRWR